MNAVRLIKYAFIQIIFTFFKNAMDGSPGNDSMRLWVDSGICPDAVSTGAVTYKTLLFPI